MALNLDFSMCFRCRSDYTNHYFKTYRVINKTVVEDKCNPKIYFKVLYLLILKNNYMFPLFKFK